MMLKMFRFSPISVIKRQENSRSNKFEFYWLFQKLTHAYFDEGWSGATVDFGRNCWITPEAAFPFDIEVRFNATGVEIICRWYCLIGTFDAFLSVDRISSRSIWSFNLKIYNFDCFAEIKNTTRREIVALSLWWLSKSNLSNAL